MNQEETHQATEPSVAPIPGISIQDQEATQAKMKELASAEITLLDLAKKDCKPHERMVIQAQCRVIAAAIEADVMMMPQELMPVWGDRLLTNVFVPILTHISRMLSAGSPRHHIIKSEDLMALARVRTILREWRG